jgi:hypothetical protein
LIEGRIQLRRKVCLLNTSDLSGRSSGILSMCIDLLHRKVAVTGPATGSTVFPNGRVIEEHNTSPLNNISPAGSFILAFTNLADNSSLADFALTAQHL